MKLKVVYVHQGPNPVDHLIHTIKCFMKSNPNPDHYNIHVITDNNTLKQQLSKEFSNTIECSSPIESEKRSMYLKNCQQSGLFKYAMDRFFILENAMETYKWDRILHFENDVCFYKDLSKFETTIQALYEPHAIITTFDHDTRAIPGIMYIPDVRTLKFVTAFACNNATWSDMELFGKVRIQFGPTIVDAFPISIPGINLENLAKQKPFTDLDYMSCSRFFEKWGVIFDAAAIGQYIDGTDPNYPQHYKPKGFINETCYVNYDKDSKIKIENGRPYIQFPKVDQKWYAIANLHVHSKNTRKFVPK